MAGGTIRVEVVGATSPEVLDAFRRLVPQLSATPPDDLDARIRAAIACTTNRVLIAQDDDDRILATLTLVVVPLPTGVRALIEDVVVDSTARQRGIGGLLVNRAVELARAEGARTIDLTSRPTRIDANRLYERLGFARRDTNVYRLDLPSSPRS